MDYSDVLAHRQLVDGDSSASYYFMLGYVASCFGCYGLVQPFVLLPFY